MSCGGGAPATGDADATANGGASAAGMGSSGAGSDSGAPASGAPADAGAGGAVSQGDAGVPELRYVQSVIDAKGGVIAIGNAELRIPSGSLTSPTMIQIELVPADPSDPDTVGETYNFGPDGLTFAPPAVLVIQRPTAPDQPSADNLTIWMRETGQTTWEETASWTIGDGVIGEIPHFTNDATRKKVNPPPTPCGTPSSDPCLTVCNRSTNKWEPRDPDDRSCGSKSKCINLQDSRAHCGTCSEKCMPGYFCQNALCTCCGIEEGGTCSGLLPCPNNQTANNDECVCECKKDTLKDPKNCGKCGNDCGRGIACNGGVCDYCNAANGPDALLKCVYKGAAQWHDAGGWAGMLTAAITWKAKSISGRVVDFAPEGRAFALGSFNQLCSAPVPTDVLIPSDNTGGDLKVDFSKSPPTYFLAASAIWTAQCSGQSSSVTLGSTWAVVPANGTDPEPPLTSTGHIVGTFGGSPIDSTWDFCAPGPATCRFY